MYGHGLSRQMEEWHKEFNGAAGEPAWDAFLDDFQTLLASKARELSEEHDNDGKFGMSKAGGCTRAAGLKLLGAEGSPFSGSTRVTFFIGHLAECIGIASLRALGYEVGGSQQAVTIGEFMHSYSDGIIADFDGEETILSVKSAAYKKSGQERRGANRIWVRRGFPELPFMGVKASQPGHWVQAQAEMFGANINQALYLVVAKDIIKAMEEDPYLGDGDGEGNGSLTFYSELIKYDDQFCQNTLLPVWEQQWADVQAGRPGAPMFYNKAGEFVRLTASSQSWKPNADKTGTYNPCNYCDFVGACKTDLVSGFRK
jgi:hypothetical protein